MRNIKKIVQLLLCIGLMTQSLQSQNDLNNIPKPDLKEEQASFSILDGFEISLYAATPMIAKPTQINFDSDGRLWLSGSHIYPQLNVNEEPSDQIVILEDSDNDGVADKSSIFYDKLIIPGGVLPDNQGGAYVASGDKLIHLSDTNGDGKADKSAIVLTGFGTEDTHHTLHRLGWGPGGKIFMLQGYYISSHVETAYGPRRLNGGGLWTYDTDTRRLEIFTKGHVNPWGHSVNYWGQSFESDGANKGFGHSFPNSVFIASPGESQSLPTLTPKSPKVSGIEIISGAHFPPSWNGNVITNDYRAHITDRYSLEEEESSYKATLEPTFLKSSHKSFRPIDVKMGPDGALYVADWYSPIIQHGEVDFRDDRRDHQHGRIWRITAKGRPLLEKPNYKESSIPELLNLLKADENWVRLLTKQTLKSREASQVLPAIDKWLSELDPQDPDYDHHRLEALWTVQTLNEMNIDLLKSVLKSETPGARSAAVRVLYYWNKNVRDALDLLKTAVQDAAPSVRREAITALSQFTSVEAFNIALMAHNANMDRSYSFALRQTCRILSKYWLPAIHNGDLKQGDDAALIFALKATEDPRATQPLIDLYNNSNNADAGILTVIGKSGTPEQLNFLTEIASTPGNPQTSDAARSLLIAAENRGIFPTKNKVKALQNLFFIEEEHIQETACALTGYWNSKELIDILKQILSTPNTSDAIKESAAQSLAMFNTEDVRKFFVQIINEGHAISTTKVAVSALVQVDLEEGVEGITYLLSKELDKETINYLIKTIIKEEGAFAALSSALEGKKIVAKTAEQASRIVQASGRREGVAELMAALAKAGAIKIASNESNNSQRYRDLLAKLKDGDAEKGKKIYLRPELACISCHKLNGEVGLTDIGSDLGSIGASAPADYIIESLFEPSKKIKEGYKSSTVTTKNGDFYAGSIIFEDANKITMKTSAGEKVSMQKSNIESRETSKVSMMPPGLLDGLEERELIDLVKYLTELGKSQ